jgi:drug/metabolite transporter (DMT)-like permease
LFHHPVKFTLTDPAQNLPQRGHLFADGILFFTALLWGTNILVFKHTISDFDPWIFNAYRLVLATITLVGLAACEAWFSKPKPTAKRQPTSWLRVVMFCLLSGFLYLIIFVKGIDLTTAGNTALILASMPMWTAILSFFILSERLPRVTWLGLLVTFIGTAVVTTQGSGGGKVSFESQYFVGNLYMLLAALAWAAGTVVSRPILETITPLRLAAMSSLITTPLHILLVADQLAAAWPTAIQPNNLIAIIYSGVFSTGVAYATWHAGVRAVGGSHASVYQNVVTLVAVIGGWIFLGELATSAQLIGGALTIAGLVLMRRGRR